VIKLLLVDDQASVRAGLRMLLAFQPDISVVGEAENGEAAVTLAERLHPDVALMDVEMPRMDGIAATAAMRESVPECAVVMLSFYDDVATRDRASAAGAVAFLGKQVSPEALLTTIRQAV
jgi:DNA-binding NarL/FixJ family response regulator